MVESEDVGMVQSEQTLVLFIKCNTNPSRTEIPLHAQMHLLTCTISESEIRDMYCTLMVHS